MDAGLAAGSFNQRQYVLQEVTNKTKANLLTAGITLTMVLFGIICKWKPAYGLIIGCSVSFTLAIILIRDGLVAKFQQYESKTR